jgi:D-alanine-D-alanine ligase-like ATP-grasp enzyme
MDVQKKLKSESARLIFDSLIKAKAKVKIISTRFSLIKITYNNKSFLSKSTSFSVNSQPSCIVANNKFLTKKVLRLANIRTPKSYLVQTPKQAREIVAKKNLFPCVIKPAKGAHGNGVYANIESQIELEQILKYVFPEKGEKDVLIEEYINGKDYRVLVVGNKVSAIMKRVPAHVIGDGMLTLRQLISKFNKNPLVGKKYEKPMCKIIINGEVKRMLNKKGINLGYIPKKNKKIFLRQNANISTGGIGKDVTNEAPSIVSEIAVQAAKAIGMKITGADVLYDEKTKKAYVLELNDTPGIDIHHFPVLGKAQDVAGDIVEYVLENNAVNLDL